MTDVITRAELASFLQIADVDNATADLAIAGATAAVRRYAPRAFITTGSHTVVLPVHGGTATLPRPVDDVTAVSWLVGNGVAVTAADWAFDGMSTISGLDCDSPSNGQQLAQYPPPTSVQVTYDGGYATIPADVKDIVLAVAGRKYDNPRGLRSSTTTVGQYAESEQYAGSGGDLAATMLLDSEIKALRLYRRTAATSRLG